MRGKEQSYQNKLNPYYITGFIDGEGSFCVSFGFHKTLSRRVEIRPEFEIELRADDSKVLNRIRQAIGCGKVYKLNYERYGWYPHIKLKISNNKDLTKYLIPFLDKYPLQARKAQSYKLFKEVVQMVARKEHLTDAGFKRITVLRNKMRKLGKKHFDSNR